MAFGKTATVIGALLALGTAADAAAQKLSKEEKQWLDETRPIMLADEQKTYRELKDKRDREEFQKIFWARRDPTPATPENEFQAAVVKARAEADAQFRVAGRRGSETDCGRVYLLLGKPDDMKSEAVGENPMLRSAETWTYRDRPGQTFAGGEAKITFEGNCELGQGNRYAEALNKVAMSKVTRPNIGFKKGDDGKLVTLADQLPKPSAAQTLLTTSRQDFTLTAEPSLYLPAEDGSVFVAGLVRADASGFAPADGKTAKLVVATRAVDASGKAYDGNERQLLAEVPADKAVVASFGMSLRPGDYTLHVAGVDPASGKGSAVTVPLKVPDFNAGGVVVSPITIVQDVQADVTVKKSDDPLADFVTGAGRLLPRYGNVFAPEDSITILAQVHGLTPVGAAPPTADAMGATFTIVKEGKVIARAPEQSGTIVSVGPIPLAKYGPGKYTVQLKVTDKVAKKDYTSEAPFQIK
jgi:GWxTD domain-containing protein